MKPQIIIVALAVLAIAPASAQTVDQLLANHALLKTELERCVQMGMPSNDDARCKTARAAEQKRFFGNGVGYTKRPVDVFPGHQAIDPQPNSQKVLPPTTGEPHG